MHRNKSLFVVSKTKNNRSMFVEVNDREDAMIRIEDVETIDGKMLKKWLSNLDLKYLRLMCRTSQLNKYKLLEIPTTNLSLLLVVDSDYFSRITNSIVELELKGDYYINIKAKTIFYNASNHIYSDSSAGSKETIINTKSTDFAKNKDNLHSFIFSQRSKVSLCFPLSKSANKWESEIKSWKLPYKRIANMYEFN